MSTDKSTDRLVIGVDFGTTFSGVAAVYSNVPQAPDEINVIKTWPGGSNSTSDKVPSEITYGPPPANRATSSSASTARQGSTWSFGAMNSSLSATTTSAQSNRPRWGFELRPEESRIRCVKLLLDDRQKLPAYVKEIELKTALRRSGKDAETVVTDYLTELWKHAKATLGRRYGGFFLENTTLDIILTVPAVWSDAAKDATLRCAKRAGMGGQLKLISEPEAAAVYTLKSIQPNHLRVGNNFIVCDAGGGTVDLISYEIKQTDPLRIEESVEGSGGCCGSVILNILFEAFVRDLIGPEDFDAICESKPRSWQTALKYFDEFVKRNYEPDADDGFEFAVPFPINDGVTPAVSEGFLMISSADVRSIFMPVIEQIIKLVEGQMQKLEAQGKSVNGIVLVGGFGQSNCLFKCLQARFAGRKRSSSTRAGSLPRFEIMQPINAWTAVVRGAVMRGLEGAGQVLSRKSRRAYGVTAARPWNSAVHSKIDKFWHANEQVWKASNQMNWFIRKGDTCMANKPVLFSFYVTRLEGEEGWQHTDELIVCDDDNLPSTHASKRFSSTRVLCKIETDLRAVPARCWKTCTNSDGGRYQSLTFVLGMQMDSGSLLFDMRVNNVEYGSVTATFN